MPFRTVWSQEKGKKIMAAGGDENGYGFMVMDENETERVGFGMKDGATGFAI